MLNKSTQQIPSTASAPLGDSSSITDALLEDCTLGPHLKGVTLSWSQLLQLAEDNGWYDIAFKLVTLREQKYIPFKSDGCSKWPDSLGGFNNCFPHDIRYYLGGTPVDKMKADCLLWESVYYSKGEKMAEIMFAGVRAAGNFPGTGFQFGYGLKPVEESL